jgi:hypothetical protein
VSLPARETSNYQSPPDKSIPPSQQKQDRSWAARTWINGKTTVQRGAAFNNKIVDLKRETA